MKRALLHHRSVNHTLGEQMNLQDGGICFEWTVIGVGQPSELKGYSSRRINPNKAIALQLFFSLRRADLCSHGVAVIHIKEDACRAHAGDEQIGVSRRSG